MSGGHRAAELVASFGGCGRLGPAPGTVGSAAALLLAAPVVAWAPASLGWPLLAGGVALASAGGVWAIRRAANGADHGWIVIDEVAGQWLALLALLPLPGQRLVHGLAAIPWLVAGFALFRLFDILKPGPVGWLDRRHDAVGVMGDDLAAGLIGAVILAAARLLLGTTGWMGPA